MRYTPRDVVVIVIAAALAIYALLVALGVVYITV